MFRPIATLHDADSGTYNLEPEACGSVMLHHCFSAEDPLGQETIPMPLAVLFALYEATRRVTGCQTIADAERYDAALAWPMVTGATVVPFRGRVS